MYNNPWNVLHNSCDFDNNVAFLNTNEIALIWSKWLPTFVMDIQPYNSFLKRLLENLRKAEKAANSMKKLYNYPSKEDYHKTIKGLNDEIPSLQNDCKVSLDSYIELHSIHNKIHGSLIPITGKGLISLFATATQSYLRTI